MVIKMTIEYKSFTSYLSVIVEMDNDEESRYVYIQRKAFAI